MRRSSILITVIATGLLCISTGCQHVRAAFSHRIAAILPHEPPPPLPAPVTAQELAVPLTYRIETYDSPALGEARTYGITLPPGYDRHPNQRYPVVFLLHGGHGSPTDWFSPQKGDALKVLSQLYRNGKLLPSIVITPDGNDKRGSSAKFDPQYIDGPNGNVSTMIGEDLVKVIQTRYRTMPTPRFWAIGGLSSGGWGAINIGLHHLDHFGVLLSQSGYFVDRTGPNNSPLQYVKTLSNNDLKHVSIYLDSGDSDPKYVKQLQQFQQVLAARKVVNEAHTFPGSHSWRFWRSHLSDSLTFANQQWQNASHR